MRTPLVALFTLLCVACECGQPESEEERLRARIDTTKVYLYAAARYAIGAGDDPQAVETREHLGAVIAYFSQHERRSRAPVGATVALGADLWAMHEQGQRIVRSEDEEGQHPILPVLLTLGRTNEIPIGEFASLDLNTEHALFLAAFTAIKLHDSVPAPIPIEVVLYEAYRTHPESMTIPWLEPAARACKAWVYGMNDFCDLASRQADAVDARSTDEWSALMPQPDPEHQQVAALRTVVHGSSGVCYLRRGDQEKAAPHLRAFCDAAEEGGAPPEDLALMRAYLAYRDGDLAATRAHLREAKQSEHLSDADREEIDRLIAHLDREDSGAVDRYFDAAFLATSLVRIIALQAARSAEASGSEDDARAMRVVRDFGGAMGAGIGSVQDAEHAAESRARSFWDELFGD